MGSMEDMIGLDLNLCATTAIRGLMGADADAGAGNGRLEKLEGIVRSLEEERRKIEVFRRELPLCVRILTDVIERMKKEKEMEQCQTMAYEKFVSPKKSESQGHARAEKMNWMSSAQLWSNNSCNIKEARENKEEKESLFLDSKSRGLPAAFAPFEGYEERDTNVLLAQKEKFAAVPGLPLPSPRIKSAPRTSSTAVEDQGLFARVVNRVPAPASSGVHLGMQAQQPPSRKARRCWSPELHERFVLVLQQLGGAQVATPRQIRELMKVDGLTNDEVKSHLQKFRLHAQKVPSASAGASENYSSSSDRSRSKSGSPQSSLLFAGSNLVLSGSARDSCEEDGKSESSIWKRQ